MWSGLQAMAVSARGKRNWVGWVFFLDLLDGLSLTLSYLLSRTVTMRYPDKEKWVPYPRFRGHLFLRTDESGENKCVACELCACICPCRCITVTPYQDERGERHPKVFDVDLSRCLFCGLCEDACPVEAIALGQLYEFSAYTADDLMVGLDGLLGTPGKAPQGGTVVAARFSTEEGVRVEPKEEEGYHWWRRIRRK